MKKLILGILFIINLSFLFCQSTIIDTLYFEEPLCGDFQFTHEDEFLAFYQTDTVYIGDGWQAFIMDYDYMLAALSFPTPNIPDNYYLESARLKLNIAMKGNDVPYEYPVFNMPYGIVYPALHLQQVHYWSDLNLEMINLPTINELIIPHTEINYGYNEYDIKNFMQYSVDQNHNHNQYRLKFIEKTDLDPFADYLIIGTSSNYPAYIVCTYKSKTGNDSFETPDFIQHITINNYPNPFNPTTKITYSINCNANVKLDIYNVKGQKVRNLLEETIHKGEHQAAWDGNDDLGKPCPSGIYFCKIQTDKATKLHKMMMIK